MPKLKLDFEKRKIRKWYERNSKYIWKETFNLQKIYGQMCGSSTNAIPVQLPGNK